MSLRNPLGLNQRDWGNYASLAACPKAASTAVAINKTDGVLQVGDRAFITGASGGPAYCSSVGSAGVNDATWALDAPASSILFTMNTASTAQLGTPVFFRSAADTPVSPTGSVTASVVAATSMASRNAVRIAGTVNGGWVSEVVTGITLPAAGYVLDVELGGIGAWMACIWPLYGVYAPGGVQNTPRGLMMSQRLSAANVNLYGVTLATTVYTRPAILTPSLGNTSAAPTAALFQRAPFRFVFEVRRLDNVTPAQWSIRCTTYSDGNVSSSSSSNVVATVAGLAGVVMDKVGFGVWSDTGGAATAEQIDILKFQIRSLDT